MDKLARLTAGFCIAHALYHVIICMHLLSWTKKKKNLQKLVIKFWSDLSIGLEHRSTLWLSPDVICWSLHWVLVWSTAVGETLSARKGEQSALLMPRLPVLSDPDQSFSSLPNRVAFPPPIINPRGSCFDLMHACMISAVWFFLHS